MDGVYQVVIGGVNARGQFAENVIHYQVTGTSLEDSYETALDLGNAVNTNIVPSMIPAMGSDCSINLLSAKLVSGSGGPTAFVPVSRVGTYAGLSYSLAVAADIAWFPGGSLNRPGHFFAWALPILAIISDSITTAFRTLLIALADALLTTLTLTSGSAQYGTYTKKTKTLTPVTDFNIRTKVTGMNKRTKPLT